MTQPSKKIDKMKEQFYQIDPYGNVSPIGVEPPLGALILKINELCDAVNRLQEANEHVNT